MLNSLNINASFCIAVYVSRRPSASLSLSLSPSARAASPHSRTIIVYTRSFQSTC